MRLLFVSSRESSSDVRPNICWLVSLLAHLIDVFGTVVMMILSKLLMFCRVLSEIRLSVQPESRSAKFHVGESVSRECSPMGRNPSGADIRVPLAFKFLMNWIVVSFIGLCIEIFGSLFILISACCCDRFSFDLILPAVCEGVVSPASCFNSTAPVISSGLCIMLVSVLTFRHWREEVSSCVASRDGLPGHVIVSEFNRLSGCRTTRFALMCGSSRTLSWTVLRELSSLLRVSSKEVPLYWTDWLFICWWCCLSSLELIRLTLDLFR